MRSYLIDEIYASDMQKITGFLKENAMKSNLDNLFWIRIPDDILNETQFEHNNCKPHVFAVELGKDWLKLELYVRSLKKIQCSCPAYATPQQKDFIINFAHHMIEQLGIRT
jgi:hypothetical protein